MNNGGGRAKTSLTCKFSPQMLLRNKSPSPSHLWFSSTASFSFRGRKWHRTPIRFNDREMAGKKVNQSVKSAIGDARLSKGSFVLSWRHVARWRNSSLLFMLIVSGSVVIIFLTRFFTGFLFSYVIGRLNTTSINTDVNGPILHSGIGYWGG